IRAGLAWFSEKVAFRAASQVKLNVRKQLMEQLLKLGPVQLVGEHSGELANILTDGVEALEGYFSQYLPQTALAALLPLTILAIVFPVDWMSGLVLLFTAPIIPFMMIFIGKNAELLNQKQWHRLARLSAHFLDVIQGITTLKLFNASRAESKVIARMSDEYRLTTMSVLRIAFLSSLVLEFLATVSIALVAVLIGFRLLWGDLHFESGFLVLLLAPEFYLPLRSMGTHYHTRMNAIGAAERIIELLEMESMPIVINPHRINKTRALSIQLENVTYAYEPGRIVLDKVSLKIIPGERMAIVGPSGAGKSTIFNLLLKFIHPQNGQIKVNGINLLDYDREDWLQQVSWVPQHPHIFSGSIIENIAVGQQSGVDLEQIRHAAHQAMADEFIEHLPSGYDTYVGDGGHGLSGGQIQRIALARAFFKNAPLLLMDEPTANLDLENEQKLILAFNRLTCQRTTLVIAHRLHTVQHADRILVINRGHIVEVGSHKQLIEQQGMYYSFVQDYQEAR
ncbi:MAG: thiol reductant ABC exporter subunit CydD, partial [Pseudomonadota bacterium]|nr:thiol reductant ABC exporter subunit CydD [Pseudomonadota bacterium]